MSPSFDVLSLAAVPGRRSRFGGKAASGGHGFRATCGSLESLVPRGLARSRRRKTQWGTQLKGRFYSPAWHRFLNSDQGADPNQLNQYAYCNGNPMVSTDPSGMFSLKSLLGDLTHGLHQFGHAMGVNWDSGLRGEAELCAVVAASYFTCGAVSDWAGGGVLGGICGGAAGGAVAGGAMGGTWKSAEMGALSGALFAGVNAGCQGLGMNTFSTGLTNAVVAGGYSQACGGSF